MVILTNIITQLCQYNVIFQNSFIFRLRWIPSYILKSIVKNEEEGIHFFSTQGTTMMKKDMVVRVVVCVVCVRSEVLILGPCTY